MNDFKSEYQSAVQDMDMLGMKEIHIDAVSVMDERRHRRCVRKRLQRATAATFSTVCVIFLCGFGTVKAAEYFGNVIKVNEWGFESGDAATMARSETGEDQIHILEDEVSFVSGKGSENGEGVWPAAAGGTENVQAGKTAPGTEAGPAAHTAGSPEAGEGGTGISRGVQPPESIFAERDPAGGEAAPAKAEEGAGAACPAAESDSPAAQEAEEMKKKQGGGEAEYAVKTAAESAVEGAEEPGMEGAEGSGMEGAEEPGMEAAKDSAAGVPDGGIGNSADTEKSGKPDGGGMSGTGQAQGEAEAAKAMADDISTMEEIPVKNYDSWEEFEENEDIIFAQPSISIGSPVTSVSVTVCGDWAMVRYDVDGKVLWMERTDYADTQGHASSKVFPGGVCNKRSYTTPQGYIYVLVDSVKAAEDDALQIHAAVTVGSYEAFIDFMGYTEEEAKLIMDSIDLSVYE